ncbi:MAG: class I tRNA ligase family protein, partial [Candidatus Pacearchaeota archaeon]|nr:class I tRNA ligase family protein [Candidatus Pacearchaeota archaeon]
KRYKQYIGKEIEVETLLGKKKIKVVGDTMVDPEFGTGAVKVTPAHDANDFELWNKHKGEIPDPIRVIGKDGRLTDVAGPYAGLKVMEARATVVEDLKAKGLLVKTDENNEHALALCYKCKSVIEPQLLEQWFLKTRPLAKPAIKAVKEGTSAIIPNSYEKTYFHWLKNIKDWNISRQNWWGIEIPAWKCQDCEEWTVSEGKTPASCSQCHGKRLEQDPDVFDTWFSSGQWPFAVLKFPQGKDYKEFYPTSVMETAYDILFFWVARMMMLSLYRTGKVPFKTIYLHGLVRDKDRQKMSKSKGNVIDPLGVLEAYGTDALRLALTIGNSPGQDTVISEDKIRGYRNFVNKLWNIARFVLLETEGCKPPKKLSLQDRKLMGEAAAVAEAVTRDMELYRFSQAVERIYHYAWHTFADKILEDSKKVLKDEKLKAGRQYALLHILKIILALLHPFAPFVTEELYQKLPRAKKQSLLMIEKWPV